MTSVVGRSVLTKAAMWGVVCLGVALIGCTGEGFEYLIRRPKTVRGCRRNIPVKRIKGRIFGGGLNLFGGGDDEKRNTGGGAGNRRQQLLWRASLDTISFMPVASADPFGGVIITDWYSPPEAPSDRSR